MKKVRKLGDNKENWVNSGEQHPKTESGKAAQRQKNNSNPKPGDRGASLKPRSENLKEERTNEEKEYPRGKKESGGVSQQDIPTTLASP